MKHLKVFEDFTEDTININNYEYNRYYNSSKSDKKRVAWDDNTQIKNFKLIKKNINSGDSLLDFGCGIGDLQEYLEKNNIIISDYLGVDINENFINRAKEKYPDNEFKLIRGVSEIKGNWDVVCAVGVFTWYITKDEFIKTIRKLHSLCHKQLLITVLDSGFLGTPYDSETVDLDKEKSFWSRTYRYYNGKLFYNLFPEFQDKISFDYAKDTLLVKIKK